MKYAKKVVCLLALLVGLGLGAQADNTTCAGAIDITPDGSQNQGTFTGVSEQRWFRFIAGPLVGLAFERSYVIIAENLSPKDVQVSVSLASVLGGNCAGSALTVVDRSGTDPLALGGARVAFKTGGSSFFVLFSVTGANGGGFRVRVEETTLFSPRWSTFGGFYTSWGFQNTTTSDISVTMHILPSGSTTPLANATFTVPAGRVVFRDTRPTDLNIGPNQAGSVLITHDGPPGGIHADAFMSNENTTPFAVIPVVVGPRTEAH